MGEEGPAVGPPLSVTLLLKHDISEAAGAPKKAREKNDKPVGRQSRGNRDWRHRGLKSEGGGGVERK